MSNDACERSNDPPWLGLSCSGIFWRGVGFYPIPLVTSKLKLPKITE